MNKVESMSGAKPARNLRERKKLRTRETLIEAGITLFAEVGFEQATIDMIAQRAEVSPRTISNYFSCKADILLEEFYSREREFTSLVLNREPGEPVLAVLQAQCESLCDRLADTDVRPLELTMPPSSVHAGLRGMTERVVGLVASELRSEAAAAADSLWPAAIANGALGTSAAIAQSAIRLGADFDSAHARHEVAATFAYLATWFEQERDRSRRESRR